MQNPSGTTSPLPGGDASASAAAAGARAAPAILRPMGACASYPNCAASSPADGAADVDALRPGTRRRGPQSRTVRMGAALYSGTSAPAGAATPAVDLEELGRLHAGGAGAAAGGVEVHYEDGARAGDVPHRDRRVAERAAAACAPDACQPLDPAVATPPSSSRRGKASAATKEKEKEKEKEEEEEDKQSTSATDNEEEEEERCCALHKLCMCELRRHRDEDDCWLAAYGNVYNVTGILRAHPGGARCLLRKAGGPDCSADMDFHTKKARRMMEQCFIGRLEPCGEPDASGQAACAVM